MHDQLARQPVKTVAPDTLRSQFFGDRQHPRHLGQAGVKGGVETRRLRQPAKMLAGKANDRQRRWRMQRGKSRGRFELLQHRVVDQAVLQQLRPAMHDAMPDGTGRRHPAFSQKPPDADDRFALGRNGRRFGGQDFPPRIPRGKLAGCFAYRLGLAGKQLLGPHRAGAVEAEFERG